MTIRWPHQMSQVALVVLVAFACASTAQAGLGDKLKKKAEAAATKKAGQAADKAVGTAEGEASEGESDSTERAGSGASENAASGSAAEISAVSTKFDFVPGDKVLFADDFTQDELGEFPARWKLSLGTFEVAERSGQRWLRCASPDGRIRMKLPAMESLPEFWTLEFDLDVMDGVGSAMILSGMTKNDDVAWSATFPQGQSLAFRSGEVFSETPLDSPSAVPGTHHVMFMARGAALKVYVDRQRMANAPDVLAAGTPSEFELRMFSPSKPMIANVRFAEGCKPAKDLLAEGKLVTYGIRFDSGSDVVRPESAPILRQIAAYLEANPAVKLQIVGHTDNVGKPASNLDLSKRRAASVAGVLSGEFKIAADRFATDGKGDTEAIASNANAEGRAMNRRVEFEKL